MTIDITGDYRVQAGDTVSVTDATAFRLADPEYQQPAATLTIAGTVNVTYTPASVFGLDRFAILMGTGNVTAGPSVTVESTGVIRIRSTVTDGPITGVSIGSFGHLTNRGTLDFASTGQVNAVSTSGSSVSFVNEGVFRVSGAANTSAVYLANGGDFTNSGSIEVTSGWGAVLTSNGFSGNFQNSGVIRLVHTDASPAYDSAAIEWYTQPLMGGGTWINTGTIEATTTALRVYSADIYPHFDFDNRGVITGAMLLGGANELLTNTGAINGAVNLGAGNDTYQGVTGVLNGALDGGAGDDLIRGASQAETLSGGAGTDTIEAGGGDDVVLGGDGADRLDGGGGANTVSFADTAGSGVSVDLSLESAVTGTGTDSVVNFQRVVGSGLADTISGTDGANTLSGGLGADRIFGHGGDDAIDGGEGQNYLRGEDGNDTLTGGSAFDDVQGNRGDDLEHGGGGNDWVVGGQNNDTLFGDDGDDIMNGNLGSDTIDGGAGRDTVRGGQGDDVIVAGAGADWISGDLGDDTLSGGAGGDIFHGFAGIGVDRITDFNFDDGDRILLDPGVTYSAAQVGADTVLTLNGGQMVLVGVQLSGLGAGWVIGA